MTDDDMDARLHAAGAAWRTATEPAPAPTTVAEPPARPPSAPGRRHRVAWLASAAVIAAALVAGGAFLLGRTTGGGHQRVGAESAALTGTVWRLVGYAGGPAHANSLATLYLGRDGTLVADDACELITARFATSGTPTPRSVQVRDYDCTDSVGEVTFRPGLAAMTHHPRWTVDGDRLTVRAGNVEMHLVAAPSLPVPTADRPTFTGATWRLTGVRGGTGATKTVKGHADLRIDRGSLLASDTCNSMSGPATVDGNRLRIKGGLAISAMGCLDNDTQTVVDDVLVDGARLALRGATLTVAKPGAGTLTYQWAPADAAATDPRRLTAVQWQLRSVAGVPAGTGASIRVGGGTLVLDSACEHVSSSATVGPGVLTSTLADEPGKGCPDELSTVHSLLTGPALWRVAGNRLVVNGPGAQGFALVFEAKGSVPDGSSALLGTWKLTGVQQDSGNSASGSGGTDTGITLTITDSSYRVTSPCPQLEGTATRHAGTVEFGRNQSTGVALSCRPNGWDSVTKVFPGTAHWSVKDGQLLLKKGTVTLTFAR